MIKKLVFSLIVIFMFYTSCSKHKTSYNNPIFATFFEELNSKSIDEFYKSYYKDKPDEYREAYLQVLRDLKKYNSDFTITDYDHYKGEKPSLDGKNEDVYILENINIKDKIFVKVENNKVKYLLSIGKGKEDIIGWL